MGMLTATVLTPNLIAQRNLDHQIKMIGDITCKSLTIVDQNGKDTVRLYTALDGAGSIGITADTGEDSVRISTHQLGGDIRVFSRYGKGEAQINANEHCGVFVVLDSNGKTAIGMLVGREDGGALEVYKRGSSVVEVSSDEHGGRVDVTGKGTKKAVLL